MLTSLAYSQIFAKAEEEDAVTDLTENDLLKGPEDSENTKAEDSELAVLRATKEKLKDQLQNTLQLHGNPRWLFDKVLRTAFAP